MVTTNEMHFDRGLDTTVIGESDCSFIDGSAGVLEYVGYDIDSLARYSTFEETAYLLLYKKMPTSSELDTFKEEINKFGSISEDVKKHLYAMNTNGEPMHVLRSLVSCLGAHDLNSYEPSSESIDLDAVKQDAIKLIVQMPILLAGFDRIRQNQNLVEWNQSHSIAWNFLNMRNGNPPTETMERAFDASLILHAEHGFNASTFTAVVTISTLSDLYSAVTAAIGALKGPLHGGANVRVMHMLQDIPSIEHVDEYINGKLSRGERVMGFGHRVYKSVDPRATYLRGLAEKLAFDTGKEDLYKKSLRIVEIMEKAVGSKGIHPNVDFFSATTYDSLGIKTDLFTPLFAMARVSGWAAHCLEQLSDNRLIRPRCEYTGPHGLEYVPIDQRSK